MMELKHTTIYCVMFGLFLSGTLGQPCQSVSDCSCGSVCVDEASGGQCRPLSSNDCKCQEGCFVLLTPNDGMMRVYSNKCYCRDPAGSRSLPRCTKLPWMHPDIPTDIEVHQENDNCYLEQQLQNGKK